MQKAPPLFAVVALVPIHVLVGLPVLILIGLLAGLPVLAVEDSARGLARAILAEKLLPPAAASDAIHAVVAAQHRVNILLTWNCKHLANPHLLARLRTFMAGHGLVLPEICTPIELVGQ